MSVQFKSQDIFYIDHRSYVSNIYTKVMENKEVLKNYTLLSNLFCILSSNHHVNRKRTYNSDEYVKETSKIKENHEKLRQVIPDYIVKNLQKKITLLETKDVRALAQHLFEINIFDHSGISGGNNSENALKCKVKDEFFLIPPNSRFYCGEIKEQCLKLEGCKYDILIADPPWWNKYIRRLKNANDKLSYSMMYNEDIAGLPVQGLLSTNCLVAMWCTNSPSHISAVKNLIFPKWGIEYLTTWYWLKVTTDLEPICAFSASCKKQPYERLVLGKVGHLKLIPCERLIVSVPSALHSHKPPLLDLLKEYVIVDNPQTLELFARYLLPQTTSIGYEPLKWQHISLYETD